MTLSSGLLSCITIKVSNLLRHSPDTHPCPVGPAAGDQGSGTGAGVCRGLLLQASRQDQIHPTPTKTWAGETRGGYSGVGSYEPTLVGSGRD